MPHLANILDDLPGDLARLGVATLGDESVPHRLLLLRGEEPVALGTLGELGEEDVAGDSDADGDGPLDDEYPAPAVALWVVRDPGEAVGDDVREGGEKRRA